MASTSATVWLHIVNLGIAYRQAINDVATHTAGCYSFGSAFFCPVFDRLQMLVKLAMLQSSLWLLHCLWPCFCFSLDYGIQYATGTDREEAV